MSGVFTNFKSFNLRVKMRELNQILLICAISIIAYEEKVNLNLGKIVRHRVNMEDTVKGPIMLQGDNFQPYKKGSKKCKVKGPGPPI